MATSSELDIPPIVRLPDEILLHIASSIDGDDACTALRHLALTHRRFRHIVKEKLIRNGVVQVHSISQYLSLLLEHPDWRPHFKHIEFRDSGEMNAFNPSQAARRACYGTIRDLLPNYPAVNLSEDFEREVDNGAIWLMVVLAVVSNTEKVSLRSTDFVQSYTHDWILDPWRAPGDLLSALGNMVWPRLKFLRVTTDDESPFSRRIPACFINLCNLQVLEITGDFLEVLEGIIGWGQVPRLPSSLEVLRVFCDQESEHWAFLTVMYEDICHTEDFSHLRRIQLCFNHPCRSVAQYAVCNTAHSYPWALFGHLDLTDFLSKWRKFNVCL
jgi:hypothetical protein